MRFVAGVFYLVMALLTLASLIEGPPPMDGKDFALVAWLCFYLGHVCGRESQSPQVEEPR